MIRKYNNVFIIYGGSGKKYASMLDKRIREIAEKERYPLKSSLIMERILTKELLNNIISLFKSSEFCVAFLTKEDCCVSGKNKTMRLRQNVVFELGMAIMQLGRDNCILLSDFCANNSDFELPTDMNSLEISYFDPNDADEIIESVIKKILQLGQNKIIGEEFEEIKKYDKLLLRENYYVDYENIFINRPIDLSNEGVNFLKDTLLFWLDECNELPHYDERCIYVFERIGFLPIFGSTAEVKKFVLESQKLIDNYGRKDISYYGGTEVLNFAKNLISCVIEYTSMKINDNISNADSYNKLLKNYLFEEIPENTVINPLVLLIYYDYLGLIYFRLYKNTLSKEYIDLAVNAFELALSFVYRVDMSLNIWSGFLNYNLARANAEKGDLNNAIKYYEKAIHIREKWLKNSKYNVTVRNAMSYEYFIARIDYIDMRRKFNIASNDQIKREYELVAAELNTYSNAEENLGQLIRIKDLLSERTTIKQEV